MRFGIVSPAIPEVPAWSAMAESLGYDSTWLFDSHMVYSDVYVIAALCAERTTRMTVGPGIAVAPQMIQLLPAPIRTLGRHDPTS
jgi:5,10-methylenetetrahydromethanopterin reductase